MKSTLKTLTLVLAIAIAFTGMLRAQVIDRTVQIDIDTAGGTTETQGTFGLGGTTVWNSVPAATGQTENLQDFDGTPTRLDITILPAVEEASSGAANDLQADGVRPMSGNQSVAMVIEGLQPLFPYAVVVWTVDGRCRLSVGDDEPELAAYVGPTSKPADFDDVVFAPMFSYDVIPFDNGVGFLLNADKHGRIHVFANEAEALSDEGPNPLPAPPPTIAGIQIQGTIATATPYSPDIQIYSRSSRTFVGNDLYVSPSLGDTSSEAPGSSGGPFLELAGIFSTTEVIPDRPTQGTTANITGRWIRAGTSRSRTTYRYRAGSASTPVMVQNDGDMTGVYIAWARGRRNPAIDISFFDSTGNITAAIRTPGNYGFPLNPAETFQFNARSRETSARVRQQRSRRSSRVSKTCHIDAFAAEDALIVDSARLTAFSAARRKPRR